MALSRTSATRCQPSKLKPKSVALKVLSCSKTKLVSGTIGARSVTEPREGESNTRAKTAKLMSRTAAANVAKSCSSWWSTVATCRAGTADSVYKKLKFLHLIRCNLILPRIQNQRFTHQSSGTCCFCTHSPSEYLPQNYYLVFFRVLF